MKRDKTCPRCGVELDRFGTKGYCSVQCYGERDLKPLCQPAVESRQTNAKGVNFNDHPKVRLPHISNSQGLRIESGEAI